jgi:hypothetical protein
MCLCVCVCVFVAFHFLNKLIDFLEICMKVCCPPQNRIHFFYFPSINGGRKNLWDARGINDTYIRVLKLCMKIMHKKCATFVKVRRIMQFFL